MASWEILREAAHGDRDALAIMRDDLLIECDSNNSSYPSATLWPQIELLARLTAAHGRAEDIAMLAAILLGRSILVDDEGFAPLSAHYSTEAGEASRAVVKSGDVGAIAILVGHIEILADVGHREAIPALTAIMESLDAPTALEVNAKVRANRSEFEIVQ